MDENKFVVSLLLELPFHDFKTILFTYQDNIPIWKNIQIDLILLSYFVVKRKLLNVL